MSLEKIKILICEDNKVIRQGLESIMKESSQIEVLESFPSAESLIEYKDLERSDIILMDIGLPGMSGIDAIKTIRARHPEILFLILTIYEDNDRIFEALCAGASGYLIKQTEPKKIIQALIDTNNGDSPMSPTIARKVVNIFQNASLIKKSDETLLTERETEIIASLADGNNYQSIGEKLFISPNTVRFHIGNIYKKLHAGTQTEAVAIAIKKGLI